MSSPSTPAARGIWHISREYAGIAEAGGLKDVVAGLASSQARAGYPVTVVLLRYGCVDLDSLPAERLPLSLSLELLAGESAARSTPETVTVYRCWHQGVRIFLLDSQRTRSKQGIYTYTLQEQRFDPAREKGSGHWDAHQMNLTLQRGALELACRLGEKPGIMHCHDGHGALLPALMRELEPYRSFFRETRALITIHNAGPGYHQEIYGLAYARQLTGLPEAVLKRALLGRGVDPLLLGAFYGTVNTVSPGYAREIRSDHLSGGLGRAYRRAGIKLSGVTNGIDLQGFDPRLPRAAGLPQAFDPLNDEMEGKARVRRDFLEVLDRGPACSGPGKKGSLASRDAELPLLGGLSCYGFLSPGHSGPLYTFVGRLAREKGIDLLIQALPGVLSRWAEPIFILLGQGERELEERLIALCREKRAAGRLVVLIGFNVRAAKWIYASGDFFLIPSLSEPCGLTDLMAQLMGNLPIVHRVGGLSKVREGFNGYSYREHSPRALSAAIGRGLADYRSHSRKLGRMRRQAFQEILDRYTWEKVMARYLALYQGS